MNINEPAPNSEPTPDLERIASSVINAAEAARQQMESPLVQTFSAASNATSPSADVDDQVPDTRLYVPDHQDWEVHIKRDSERYFCYAKNPGEDWFHLLLNGEIYVSFQHEKYCLRCALRLGFLTLDRLFWQHRVLKKTNRLV